MFQKKRKNESAPVTNRMDTQDNGDALFETLNKAKKTSFGNRGNGYMGSGGQMPNAGGSFGGGSNYGGGTAGGSGRPTGNKQMPSGN